MKVNMSLLVDGEEQTTADVPAEKEERKPVEATVAEADEDDGDEEDSPKKGGKVRTFVLTVGAAAGFFLVLWAMVGFVNTVRLSGQGQAVNIVYDKEDLDNFMDGTSGSGSTTASADELPDVSEITGSTPERPSIDPNADEATLRKIAEDALNEAALVRQELKNAEDMLESSLSREEELQQKIDELTGQH